jgi:hypothetical protein
MTICGEELISGKSGSCWAASKSSPAYTASEMQQAKAREMTNRYRNTVLSSIAMFLFDG